MNHAISGEILAEEVRFPGSKIFFATLDTTVRLKPLIKELFTIWLNGASGSNYFMINLQVLTISSDMFHLGFRIMIRILV